MAISIEIPAVLRPYSDGNAVITINPAEHQCDSVGAALGALASQCPGVIDRVMTEQGQLRAHVNVFVNNENTRHTEGLDTPIGDPSTITILAAISGG